MDSEATLFTQALTLTRMALHGHRWLAGASHRPEPFTQRVLWSPLLPPPLLLTANPRAQGSAVKQEITALIYYWEKRNTET